MKRVLIVDDDQENTDLLSRFLSSESHSIQTAGDGDGALHRIRAWKPHLILLDVNLPGLSGLELLPRIRLATPDDYVAVVLVSGNMTPEDVAKGMDAGADDYLTKPFRAQELVTRVRAMFRLKDLQDSLRRANHRIEELSSTDDLTGLLNVRTLFRRAEDEISKSRRFRKPVSALALNLDRFSSANQGHGFNFGNFILHETGVRIKQCLRSIDLAARVGGDEFFIFLPETDLANAEFMAERIRDAIVSSPYKESRQGAAQTLPFTASIGVAGINYDQPEQGMADLVHTASEALRSAKSGGPNRIEVYSFA